MTPLGGGSGLKAEINVTPLVDVVLVLLIIFMVVTPLLTRGKDVQLVPAKHPDSQREARDDSVLTVTSDKALWLELERTTPEALVHELSLRQQANPNLELLIKADAHVTVGDLRPVLSALKRTGISQIRFAVQGSEGEAR